MIQCDYILCSWNYLHPLIESSNGFVDPKMDDDNKLFIFRMITRSIELAKKIVKRKPLVFHYYWMDVKNIECSFHRNFGMPHNLKLKDTFFFLFSCVDNSGDSINPNNQGSLLSFQSMRRTGLELRFELPTTSFGAFTLSHLGS